MRVSILVVNIFPAECRLAMLTGHHTAGRISLGPILLLVGLAVVLAVLRCVIALPEWHWIICLNQFFLKYREPEPAYLSLDFPFLLFVSFYQVLREGSLIRFV